MNKKNTNFFRSSLYLYFSSHLLTQPLLLRFFLILLLLLATKIDGLGHITLMKIIPEYPLRLPLTEMKLSLSYSLQLITIVQFLVTIYLKKTSTLLLKLKVKPIILLPKNILLSLVLLVLIILPFFILTLLLMLSQMLLLLFLVQ